MGRLKAIALLEAIALLPHTRLAPDATGRRPASDRPRSLVAYLFAVALNLALVWVGPGAGRRARQPLGISRVYPSRPLPTALRWLSVPYTPEPPVAGDERSERRLKSLRTLVRTAPSEPGGGLPPERWS